VEKTVPFEIDIIEYDNGIFIDNDNHVKLKLNLLHYQEEIELLRAELSKFEPVED
jgi:hypothetical protein